MSYISKSNSEIILDIKNFTISYSMPYYRSQTFRDLFVYALKSPIDFILNESDKVIVIDNINLQIHKGERVGIIGNNGSGKTSLCRYICGIFGRVEKIKINGNVKGIFDTEVIVLPELSGRENLEVLTHFFFPELTKVERKDVIQEAAEFSELGKFLDVPFKLYSKGMRARLFLSLISSRSTDLLILDEVFNGADHFFSEKMTKRIRKVIDESSAAILISHSHDLILEVCNRVIVFDNKKIIFDGDPVEGVNYYRTHCQTSGIQGN
ncbi:MAG: ATP-binding cassette domain-containing protein [Bacteriovorax sp.]|nr:ATP-binding cassette domain-containing protein [Bacteriovorax sp.]